VFSAFTEIEGRYKTGIKQQQQRPQV